MRRIAIDYICVLVIMLGLDAVWLTLVAGPQFRATLGDLLLPGFRPVPAILFYLCYAAAVLVFAIPLGAGRGWAGVLGYGVLLGFICYGTYDLTNFATLRPWTLQLVLLDMGWGMFATGVAAVGGWSISGLAQRMFG